MILHKVHSVKSVFLKLASACEEPEFKDKCLAYDRIRHCRGVERSGGATTRRVRMAIQQSGLSAALLWIAGGQTGRTPISDGGHCCRYERL